MKLKPFFIGFAIAAAPAALFAGPRIGFGFNFALPLYVPASPPPVVVVQQAPMATEAIPPSPGPDYVWISGHWEWDAAGRRWAWYASSWQVRPTPSSIWQTGYWTQGEGGWIWVPSRWVTPAPASAAAAPPVSPPTPPSGEIVVDQAPPAPIVEQVYPAPGPDYVWIGGFWCWSGGWLWAPGHYAHPPVRGSLWIGGRWEPRGARWGWSPGHWRR